MTKDLIALLLSGMVVAGAGAGPGAQAPPVSGQTGGAAPITAAPLMPTAAMTLSVRGTIDKYDRLTRMLVLSTPTGTLQFRVAPTTRIRQGWHKVDPADLPALASHRATIRYTESSGDKVVESVHIFGK
jgi:hypothetical protein